MNVFHLSRQIAFVARRKPFLFRNRIFGDTINLKLTPSLRWTDRFLCSIKYEESTEHSEEKSRIPVHLNQRASSLSLSLWVFRWYSLWPLWVLPMLIHHSANNAVELIWLILKASQCQDCKWPKQSESNGLLLLRISHWCRRDDVETTIVSKRTRQARRSAVSVTALEKRKVEIIPTDEMSLLSTEVMNDHQTFGKLSRLKSLRWESSRRSRSRTAKRQKEKERDYHSCPEEVKWRSSLPLTSSATSLSLQIFDSTREEMTFVVRWSLTYARNGRRRRSSFRVQTCFHFRCRQHLRLLILLSASFFQRCLWNVALTFGSRWVSIVLGNIVQVNLTAIKGSFATFHLHSITDTFNTREDWVQLLSCFGTCDSQHLTTFQSQIAFVSLSTRMGCLEEYITSDPAEHQHRSMEKRRKICDGDQNIQSRAITLVETFWQYFERKIFSHNLLFLRLHRLAENLDLFVDFAEIMLISDTSGSWLRC